MRLYIATNLKNGKRYVGMTSTSLARRVSSHCLAAAGGSMTIFHCAIRKHGIDAFEFKEVAQSRTRPDLIEAERALIAQEGTRHPAGYNMTPGGDGFSGRHTAKARANMAAAQQRVRKAETDEQKRVRAAAISAAKKGKAQPWCSDLGKKQAGRKRSQEFKDAVSAGMKAFLAGAPPGEMRRRALIAVRGPAKPRSVPVSDETRARMREASALRYADPQAREVASEAARRGWIKRRSNREVQPQSAGERFDDANGQ